jgi:myo-inositol-1(or 4)-monophosphatase
MTSLPSDLQHIDAALDAVTPVLERFAGNGFRKQRKESGDWVTEADLEVNRVLRDCLVRPGEGWLSEETLDDSSRLACERVWVVDPIDGTKEFVSGIPEWCVSIGLVIDGQAVAGGICNPLSGLRVVGGVGLGCRYSGAPCSVQDGAQLHGIEVLASRSEVARGEWERYSSEEFTVVPTGSVAYKLARVAAGTAAATWTLVPKSEWDVAAGVALVHSAGGIAVLPDGSAPRFNRADVLLPGLIAAGPERLRSIRSRLADHQNPPVGDASPEEPIR